MEPNGDADNSIRSSLTASGVKYNCEVGSAEQGTHHTRLASLPQFLIVRINKYADGLGVATPQCVRVAGRDMERNAVIHHEGHTPDSGHYTATVAPQTDLAYVCNDGEVAPLRQLSWSNGYLIFLRKTGSSDTHPAAEETDIEELDSSESEAGDIDSEGCDEGMMQAT